MANITLGADSQGRLTATGGPLVVGGGTTGATGPVGPQGVAGSPGPQGIQGVPGVIGATGPRGLTGSAGVAGQVGPQGAQGVPGQIGSQGAQGVPGQIGPQGAPGPTGPAGSGTGTTAVTDNVIDVQRDFGAKTDGSDTRLQLQAALTAGSSRWGGTIRIPFGRYIVSRPPGGGPALSIPGDNYACLTIIGDGAGNEGQGGGTIIEGNVDDWLLRTVVSSTIGTPIKTVRGICFVNHSTRPATDTENTSGCLYIGGSNAGISVEGCEVSAAGGIGLYIPIFGARVVCTSLFGPGLGNPGLSGSYGFIGSADVLDCKIAQWGTGLNSAWGMGKWSNIDLEVCQDGMMIGYLGIPTMNWSEDAMDPAGARPCNYGIVEAITMESCHGTFIACVNPANVRISGVGPQSYQVAADYGVRIYGTASSSVFEQLDIGGMFSKAGFAFDVGGADYNNRLENVRTNIYNSPAGVVPVIYPGPLPNGQMNANTDPNLYINCRNLGQFTGVPFDGAVPFSQAFPSPGGFGRTMIFTDSVDPTWDITNARSNVGKPIAGGGTKKVRGMWNDVLRQWVIAG